MGFFSWNCKHCGKEILSPWPPTKWSEATVVTKDGYTKSGIYDGYGRLETAGGRLFDILDEHADDEFTIYHTHCWQERHGGFDGPCESAPNQGHFFDQYQLDRDYPIDGGWARYFGE